jgi:hypothetical protein
MAFFGEVKSFEGMRGDGGDFAAGFSASRLRQE